MATVSLKYSGGVFQSIDSNVNWREVLGGKCCFIWAGNYGGRRMSNHLAAISKLIMDYANDAPGNGVRALTRMNIFILVTQALVDHCGIY